MRTTAFSPLIVGALFVVTMPFALATARYPAYSREVSETADGWIVCYSMLSDNSTSAYKTDFSLCNTPGEPATQMRTDVFKLPKGYTADVTLISATYSDLTIEWLEASPYQTNPPQPPCT